MPQGSLLFVHGTGVRLAAYVTSYENAKLNAAAAGLPHNFHECLWGDPLGAVFKGLSLPDPPPAQDDPVTERWNQLYADPLFELRLLTHKPPDVASSFNFTQEPKAVKVWKAISAYVPSTDLLALLDPLQLTPFWQNTWPAILTSGIPEAALTKQGDQYADAAHAIARAVVAQLTVEAIANNGSGPDSILREKLVQRLVRDWETEVLGVGSFLLSLLGKAATPILRSKRNSWSRAASLTLGDILLYQSRASEIHAFIRKALKDLPSPIVLMGHSLGGIACVDLLALPDPPRVDYLVTAGSQAPLLYELGALISLKPPQKLPEAFPKWLNFFDRNDFLSYVARPLLTSPVDHEIVSGQPFPLSHGAYFGSEGFWDTVKTFTKR